MQFEEIRNAVKSLYDRVGDVARPATLTQKDYEDYTPGSDPVAEETAHKCRLIETRSPTLRSLVETGPVLDKSYQIGLLEIEGYSPKAGDELSVQDEVYTLQQVAPMDLGAGILFEIWYD